MSARTLAQQLEIEEKEAANFVKKFNQEFSGKMTVNSFTCSQGGVEM